MIEEIKAIEVTEHHVPYPFSLAAKKKGYPFYRVAPTMKK
jgi:hypothetical protein